jgi:hypothetical protein
LPALSHAAVIEATAIAAALMSFHFMILFP